MPTSSPGPSAGQVSKWRKSEEDLGEEVDYHVTLEKLTSTAVKEKAYTLFQIGSQFSILLFA